MKTPQHVTRASCEHTLGDSEAVDDPQAAHFEHGEYPEGERRHATGLSCREARWAPSIYLVFQLLGHRWQQQAPVLPEDARSSNHEGLIPSKPPRDTWPL